MEKSSGFAKKRPDLFARSVWEEFEYRLGGLLGGRPVGGLLKRRVVKNRIRKKRRRGGGKDDNSKGKINRSVKGRNGKRVIVEKEGGEVVKSVGEGVTEYIRG